MKIASSALALAPEGPLVFGISVDFVLFGMTLLGIALFHQHTLRVALAGSVTIAIYKIVFTGFKTGPGVLSRCYCRGIQRRRCPESIGQNMPNLRCLEEADADVENSTGCDQPSDAVRNDNTAYSNQGRDEFFRNPLLVKQAESLSSRSRPVNHATGTPWGEGE
jgi:hypothetical protein